MKLIILLALCLFPAVVVAQTSIITTDPNPKTKGCRTVHTAVHANGDTVTADNWGQWRTNNGKPIQNGGKDYVGCETEALVRTDDQGQTVWEVRPTDSRSDVGFKRQDEIVGVAALPDGRTVAVAQEDVKDDDMSTVILMFSKNGDLLWSVETAVAPKFAIASPIIGDGGELFLSYFMTNYGYEGGKFKFPGGKLHSLRKSERRQLIMRLNPNDGKLLWEKKGLDLVDARNGELLATRGQFSKKKRMRFTIQRMNYAGKVLSSGQTPWLKSARVRSMIRWKDQLLMTNYESEVESGRVKNRYSRFRAFSMNGKVLHERALSDTATLAQPLGNDQIYITAPADCVRGIDTYSCATTAIDVLSLDDPTAPGAWSRIELPEVHLLNRRLWAKSIGKRLWFGGVVFEGESQNEPGQGAIVTHATPAQLTPQKTTRFVWQPVPEESIPKRGKMEAMF